MSEAVLSWHSPLLLPPIPKFTSFFFPVYKINWEIFSLLRQSSFSNSKIVHIKEKASNIVRIQRFQSNVLRSILDAPWYVSNHTDLNIPLISDLINTRFQQFHSKLSIHPPLYADSTDSGHGTSYEWTIGSVAEGRVASSLSPPRHYLLSLLCTCSRISWCYK
jgi:hypothetical protein